MQIMDTKTILIMRFVWHRIAVHRQRGIRLWLDSVLCSVLFRECAITYGKSYACFVGGDLNCSFLEEGHGHPCRHTRLPVVSITARITRHVNPCSHRNESSAYCEMAIRCNALASFLMSRMMETQRCVLNWSGTAWIDLQK
jgi:hypothetical protein